ncbi:hypothetical protein MMC16_004955 [Acarospora aff. strigata]|nr:hypothetical protein [Acarospora aff. strigata]
MILLERPESSHQREKHPENETTKTKFLELAHVINNDGCALFGGLINTHRFQQLIARYAEKRSGNETFLHSYVNLANHPGFLTGSEYNDAFAHPLLIALIAYFMGGALRIIDMRGKDTDPISVNAQDNMLYIDNTPFREEYKVLVGWQRGVPKGPAGQTFTYLPGTHKGNWDILLDSSGDPWSTERDSLFASDDAIDGLFAFQAEATGRPPTVVEVQYPDQPISIAFAAGALVHYRYRTEHGNHRSCMITTFHVCSDNPEALVNAAPSNDKPRSLVDFLIGHQDAKSTPEFMSLLSAEAHRMETKISETFDPSYNTGFTFLAIIYHHHYYPPSPSSSSGYYTTRQANFENDEEHSTSRGDTTLESALASIDDLLLEISFPRK